jgi:hypothetical protein
MSDFNQFKDRINSVVCCVLYEKYPNMYKHYDGNILKSRLEETK